MAVPSFMEEECHDDRVRQPDFDPIAAEEREKYSHIHEIGTVCHTITYPVNKVRQP